MLTSPEHELSTEVRLFADSDAETATLHPAVVAQLHGRERNLVDLAVEQHRARALPHVALRTRKLAPRVHLHARTHVLHHRRTHVHHAPHSVASRDVSVGASFVEKSAKFEERVERANGENDDRGRLRICSKHLHVKRKEKCEAHAGFVTSHQ